MKYGDIHLTHLRGGGTSCSARTSRAAVGSTEKQATFLRTFTGIGVGTSIDRNHQHYTLNTKKEHTDPERHFHYLRKQRDERPQTDHVSGSVPTVQLDTTNDYEKIGIETQVQEFGVSAAGQNFQNGSDDTTECSGDKGTTLDDRQTDGNTRCVHQSDTAVKSDDRYNGHLNLA
ncbi:hypothetical protein J6590_050307 [Homalodisca vitripennis]|nr:hypothetical protein J6590_050307 [Homalodisca vitripennis]